MEKYKAMGNLISGGQFIPSGDTLELDSEAEETKGWLESGAIVLVPKVEMKAKTKAKAK